MALGTTPTATKVKDTWNQFLEPERESAPGDYIAEWLRRQVKAGIEVVSDYARVAKERVVVLSSGKSFLDQGGAAVQAPILAKKIACNAVDLDIAVTQQLAHLASLNAQDLHFAVDPSKRRAVAAAADAYARAGELLATGLPPAPEWGSNVERDAGMIMQFRLAKASLGSYVGISGMTAISQQQPAAAAPAGARLAEPTIDDLIAELFRLQDLNANGVLEEEELVKLNEKVHILHYGRGTDMEEVRRKYKGVFRDKLDAHGRPVPLEVFHKYMKQVLVQLDTDPRAQTMILEQFIAEAESAREAFRFQSFASFSDAPFLSKLGIERPEPIPERRPEPIPEQHLTPIASRTSSGSTSAFASAAPSGCGGAGASSGGYAAAPSPCGSSADRGVVAAGGGGCAVSRGSSGVGVGGLAPMGDLQPLPPHASASASGAGAPRASRAATRKPVPYVKGERVQVWSNSKKQWLDGSVEDIFETDTFAQGYAVRAGTFKVVSPAGMKWITPDQASEVRKMT
eukprot:TRINITY_DN13049_c0_g1_i1.p1 TRINITY_DN13049_c0_g1~~TRINITY_DN13049_c0_g1_i1.p1  ORF type:complete len:513 (+),score=130.33 TRINITY_DN13049_c0_g1_i1:161-1699(+)